jgi:sterol desaturase/sphingolipid hydroxylase (fatty acid hydroxylase superfamily)
MHFNILGLAIPLFISLMILEYFLSLKKEKKLFHFEETVANLNIGIAERLTDLFTTGLFFFFFDWIQNNYGIFHIHATWLTWIVLFLVTDFIWYWYHRFGHEVNLGWAVHVVHHQSEDFNYTVSARITVFQSLIRCLFWSLLPLIGFPATMISFFLLIHGAYPFFTHTQLIGKLGALEYFLVTPSHHRVHHSSNEKYLDKNYGDILIIWDKFFGTFVEETEKPVYGLTKNLNSYSFLWQMFHFPLELSVSIKYAKGIKNKLKIIFGKPDLINPSIRTSLEHKLFARRTSKQLKNSLYKYIIINTSLTLIILFITISFEKSLSNKQLLFASIFIVISSINSGAMLEQRRWVFYLDYFRVAVIFLFISSFQTFLWLNLTILPVFLLALIYNKSISNKYYNYLYTF